MSDLRPNLAYRQIVDELVQLAKANGYVKRQLSSHLPDTGCEHRSTVDSFAFLSDHQRQQVTALILDERNRAIHDTLALLSYWIDCKGLGLTIHGESLPVDESGMGLHGDYVGRRDGWQWPDDDR